MYRFTRTIATVMMELVLPKKAAFQGVLYQTLTDGRDPKVVQEHFDEHRDDIKEMLAGDYPELTDREEYFEAIIQQVTRELPTLYTGYSMYEVDGVYFTGDEQSPTEERTQMIRLYFNYNDEHINSTEEVIQVRRFIRSERSLARYTPVEPEYRELLDRCERWINAVSLFVYGFLIHRITLAIEDNPDLFQREIWVASLWNPTLFRFLPVAEHKTAARKQTKKK